MFLLIISLQFKFHWCQFSSASFFFILLPSYCLLSVINQMFVEEVCYFRIQRFNLSIFTLVWIMTYLLIQLMIYISICISFLHIHACVYVCVYVCFV